MIEQTLNMAGRCVTHPGPVKGFVNLSLTKVNGGPDLPQRCATAQSGWTQGARFSAGSRRPRM